MTPILCRNSSSYHAEHKTNPHNLPHNFKDQDRHSCLDAVAPRQQTTEV